MLFDSLTAAAAINFLKTTVLVRLTRTARRRYNLKFVQDSMFASIRVSLFRSSRAFSAVSRRAMSSSTSDKIHFGPFEVTNQVSSLSVARVDLRTNICESYQEAKNA